MAHNLILVGPMGSGKTTLGRYAATKLGLAFVDSDQEIERRTKRTIPELFQIGESYFREVEAETLSDILRRDHQVVATGGGVVLRRPNRVRLRECSHRGDKVIWLQASPQVIYARVGKHTERPLLLSDHPLETLRDLAEFREPLYRQVADFAIDTDRLGIVELFGELCASLHKGGC